MDNIIEAKELQIERKHFYVEFRENDRGRFLRITEEAHGRRNTIIVPSTGLEEFNAAIDDVLASTERATVCSLAGLRGGRRSPCVDTSKPGSILPRFVPRIRPFCLEILILRPTLPPNSRRQSS